MNSVVVWEEKTKTWTSLSLQKFLVCFLESTINPYKPLTKKDTEKYLNDLKIDIAIIPACLEAHKLVEEQRFSPSDKRHQSGTLDTHKLVEEQRFPPIGRTPSVGDSWQWLYWDIFAILRISCFFAILRISSFMRSTVPISSFKFLSRSSILEP